MNCKERSHVAFLSHGVPVTLWNALKTNANACDKIATQCDTDKPPTALN